jgi:hypothetical protein
LNSSTEISPDFPASTGTRAVSHIHRRQRLQHVVQLAGSEINFEVLRAVYMSGVLEIPNPVHRQAGS